MDVETIIECKELMLKNLIYGLFFIIEDIMLFDYIIFLI